jgi:glyoxylase-like metal-dependent hydrolase (beta-lactamase superfamily II)
MSTTMPSTRIVLAATVATLTAAASSVPLRSTVAFAAQNPSAAGGVELLPVKGNIHMIAGAGGNIAVSVGEDGILLVDAGSEPTSEQVLAAIRRLSSHPIRYILTTSLDQDHIGGNVRLAKAGASLGASRALEGAEIIGHENVLLRLSKPPAPGATAMPYGAWPTATYFTDEKDFSFNDEAVVLMHQPAAHTDGDTMVQFRSSDVIVTGDVMSMTSFPTIDTANGGSIQGIINALNHVLKLAVPKRVQEGGTAIIPGHGRLCEEHEVLEYRDMVVIVRDRVKDLVGKGNSLEQVLAAQPTLDYDARYGAASGRAFVEAIYRELGSSRATK